MDLLPVGTPIRFLDLIIGHLDDYDTRIRVLAGKGEQGWIAGYTWFHSCIYLVENEYEETFPVNSTDFEVISN